MRNSKGTESATDLALTWRLLRIALHLTPAKRCEVLGIHLHDLSTRPSGHPAGTFDAAAAETGRRQRAGIGAAPRFTVRGDAVAVAGSIGFAGVCCHPADRHCPAFTDEDPRRHLATRLHGRKDGADVPKSDVPSRSKTLVFVS